MNKINKAKDLVIKAHELRASKSAFLREFTIPIREQINKINLDNMLSPEGRYAKTSEIKEKASKLFMREVSLRKQAYQHYLNKAKRLAKETIEENFISADDATRAKFQREFAELKFKIALKDEKGAFREIKSYVDKTPNSAYASLILENFHELVGKFNSNELKAELTKTYDKLKADFTPEEVSLAFDIIDDVDSSINNKMFTVLIPGTDPSLNPEFGIISELFNRDTIRYYQNPEEYYAKKQDEKAPEFVDPDEIAEQKEQEKAKQKSRVDQAYANLEAIMRQKADSGELKL
jgi:hypothetical protein